MTTNEQQADVIVAVVDPKKNNLGARVGVLETRKKLFTNMAFHICLTTRYIELNKTK